MKLKSNSHFFFYVYDTHECFICLNFKLIKADLNGVSDFSVFKKGFCGFLNGKNNEARLCQLKKQVLLYK